MLRYTDKFDDPNLTGEMLVTVSLKKVSVGTRDRYVQAGLPDAIPLDACYLGWQDSLRNLARLVDQRSINSAAEMSQRRRDRGASCLAGS